MPRISPEARGAAMRHAAQTPPPPPTGLSKAAATIWRQAVAERPGDWFSPIAQRLLHILVRQLVTASDLQDSYDAEPIGSERAVILLKQMLATSGSCAAIAVRLRLTPQQLVDRRSGRITEKGRGEEEDDGLLGGAGAEWGSAPVRTAARSFSDDELLPGYAVGNTKAWPR